MAKLVWPPSEKVLRKIECMGRSAADITMPTIRIYLLDSISRMNPTYVEASLTYGDLPSDNKIYSNTSGGEVYDGPYELKALYQLKASDDVSVGSDENGFKITMSGFVMNIPRKSLRSIGMINAMTEEKVRLPSIGDVVEILDTNELVESHFTDSVIGPYYFVISEVNAGKTIGYTNYWVELIVKGEATSKFDPARMINKSSSFILNSTKVE